MVCSESNSYSPNELLSGFHECITWNNSDISTLAFHLLVVPCPSNINISNHHLEKSIEAPSTFFVQLLRLSLCISFIIIILALYNSIEVLGRTVFSIASCSLHWVFFFFLLFCKSLVLVIMVPVLSKILYGSHCLNEMISAQVNINLGGFLLVTLLQYATTLTLFCSLEHEFKFRTSEYASVEAPLSRRCGPFRKLRLYITWPRVVFLCVGIVSLLLLIAIEITFAYDRHLNNKGISNKVCPHYKAEVPSPLVWVWLFSVLLMRVGIVVMGVGLLLIRHESLRLTIPAKIYLVLGILLSLAEDIPNSILTLANTANHAHCLKAITSFDICQLLGALSLVAYLLFVRSQYLRVEQESKLTVVWDMQRLLQVNGRKDYRTH